MEHCMMDRMCSTYRRQGKLKLLDVKNAGKGPFLYLRTDGKPNLKWVPKEHAEIVRSEFIWLSIETNNGFWLIRGLHVGEEFSG